MDLVVMDIMVCMNKCYNLNAISCLPGLDFITMPSLFWLNWSTNRFGWRGSLSISHSQERCCWDAISLNVLRRAFYHHSFTVSNYQCDLREEERIVHLTREILDFSSIVRLATGVNRKLIKIFDDEQFWLKRLCWSFWC